MLRACSVDDIPYLLPLLEEITEERSRFDDVIPDPVHTTKYLTTLINHGGIVITEDSVLGEDGRFTCVMMGAISQPWYSSRLEAAEFLLYITKARRGGLLAARLISEFVGECRDRGAVKIYAGSTLGINDDLATRLYSKLGFDPSGVCLVKEL